MTTEDLAAVLFVACNVLGIWAALTTWLVWWLIKREDRVYRYACDHAKDDHSERGRAYSDMATVITLGGHVDRAAFPGEQGAET